MKGDWDGMDHLQAHCDMLNRMQFTIGKGIEYFVFGAPPHRKIDTRPIRQASLMGELESSMSGSPRAGSPPEDF